MTMQLTILGLGQIGSSVGLALQNYQDAIIRVGHDKSREAVNLAKENDAVDRTTPTLSGAVKDADIVLLALPLHEIYPVLETIAPDLKADALVLETAPMKNTVLSWVKELLPEGIHYVGLLPVIKAEYLDEIKHGPETAHDDLFEGNLMAVITSHTASEGAINKAVNFVQLLGATPYFIDPAEIDGIISMTHLMPQLLAAAMLDVSQNAPGWREGRKLAGKAYSQLTNSFGKAEIPDALAAETSFNHENTKRLINDIISCLVELRDLETTPGETELASRFQKLQKSRDTWLQERQLSPWTEPPREKIPPKESFLAPLLGFRRSRTNREDE
jgi:prephenate dehydrogenase